MDNKQMLEDLEQLMRSAQPVSQDEAYTVKELADSFNRSQAWVREALRESLRAGAWEVIRLRRANLAGIMQTRKAYRPIPKSKRS